MNHLDHPRRRHLLAPIVIAAGVALGACSSSGSSTPAASSPAVSSNSTSNGTPNSTTGQVLPVSSNPIVNTSTVQAFTIDSVLVENNVDAAGKTADDHLEIAVTNTSSAELAGFEVYYTFDDQTAQISESYDAKLPASFTVAPGATRVIHFDNSGAPDHFAVSDFSLYATSTNALDVTVIVSATDAAPQTATVQKDAGGTETAD
jgi:hypothetical protein